MQIFGRAGRPQFDKYGEGTIITTHDKLSHYLTLLTQQNPIESQFQGSLADNLNAEVSFFKHLTNNNNRNTNINDFCIPLFILWNKKTEGFESVFG